MQTPQEILASEFKKRKDNNPNFSLRSFARWLGISPAQLSQMITGKRNISLKTLAKINNRLDLSPLEKKSVLNSLLESKKHNTRIEDTKTLLMKEDQFRIIADWYHFAILALTKINNAKADPRWISRRLGISVSEANQAVIRLVRLGLLQTKEAFKQVSDPISVGSNVPSEAIRKYHKQNLSLAIEKIETIPNNLREFQSISIPVNLDSLKKYKVLIDQFLEEISQTSNKESGSEIYNLNVQFFPITKSMEDLK